MSCVDTALQNKHVSMKSMLIFYVVMPCGLVERYQRFGVTYSLRCQDWYLPANLHGVTIQKTNIDIFTAMRTSYFYQVSIMFNIAESCDAG
jgi:hypothetical protein